MQYLKEVKGYKVWCGAAHECVISRYAVFHAKIIIRPHIAIFYTNLTNKGK